MLLCFHLCGGAKKTVMPELEKEVTRKETVRHVIGTHEKPFVVCDNTFQSGWNNMKKMNNISRPSGVIPRIQWKSI